MKIIKHLLFVIAVAISISARAGTVVGTTEVKYWTNITMVNESLASIGNWTSEGSATWSAGSGHTHASATGVASLNNVLRYTGGFFTAARAWTMSFQVVMLTNTTVVGCGIRGYASAFVDSTAITLFSAVDGTISYYGGAFASMTGYNGNSSTTNGALPIATNSTLQVTYQKRGWNYSTTVSNMTTHLVTYSAMSMNPQNFTPTGSEAATGNPAIWAVDGTADFSNFTFTLDALWPVDLLLVGDSISAGVGASSDGNSFAAKLESLGSVAVSAVSGSTVQEALLRTNEINALSPSNIVILIGENNVIRGDTASTIYTNIAYLASNVVARGSVFICQPIPSKVLDMSGVANFVRTNWDFTKVIDCYSCLQTNWGNNIARADLMFDNAHPNDLGQDILFHKIRAKILGYK